MEAGFEVFGMVPFGKVAKGGKSAAKRVMKKTLANAATRTVRGVAKRVAKFVNLPALGETAKTLLCPIRALVGFPGCFAAGTPVQTEHGTKAIETIQAGDKVWARDEWDLEGRVSGLGIEHHDRPLYDRFH